MEKIFLHIFATPKSSLSVYKVTSYANLSSFVGLPQFPKRLSVPQTQSRRFLTPTVSTALYTSRCVLGRFTFVHLLDTHLTPLIERLFSELLSTTVF